MQIRKRDRYRDAEKIGWPTVDRLAVEQHADLRGGSSDIHRDHVIETVSLRQVGAGMNSQNRSGFDGVNRLGLGASRHATVDMTHQESTGVPGSLAKVILGLEQGGRERSMRVRIDQRGVRARLVLRGFGNIAPG